MLKGTIYYSESETGVWRLRGAEWLLWVPAHSANARFTLSSRLPSLLLKSAWYSASLANFRLNLHSMV